MAPGADFMIREMNDDVKSWGSGYGLGIPLPSEGTRMLLGGRLAGKFGM